MTVEVVNDGGEVIVLFAYPQGEPDTGWLVVDGAKPVVCWKTPPGLELVEDGMAGEEVEAAAD
jgi:hypothetical protein